MYYPDVPALDPEDIELLCNEYIAHNKHLDPHIADRLGVKRGLRNPDGTGVLAGITNVSSVIGYEKLPCERNRWNRCLQSAQCPPAGPRHRPAP